jgi:hypothetical protein
VADRRQKPKPCPFCGTEPHVGPSGPGAQVWCLGEWDEKADEWTGCGAKMVEPLPALHPDGIGPSLHHVQLWCERRAIERWNKRVT